MTPAITLNTFTAWFWKQAGRIRLCYEIPKQHYLVDWGGVYRQFVRVCGQRAWNIAVSPSRTGQTIYSRIAQAYPKHKNSGDLAHCTAAVRDHIHSIRQMRHDKRQYCDELFNGGKTIAERKDKVTKDCLVSHIKEVVHKYKCGVRINVEWVDRIDDCGVTIATKQGFRRSYKGYRQRGVVECIVTAKVMRGLAFSQLYMGPMSIPGRYHRIEFGKKAWPYHTACLGGYKFEIRNGRQVWIVKLAMRGKGSTVSHSMAYAVLINSKWIIAPCLRDLDRNVRSFAATHIANHLHRDILMAAHNDRITVNACWNAVNDQTYEFLYSGLADTHLYLGIPVPRYWQIEYVPFQ